MPKSISKQVEIVTVEHMDEVLSHSLILDDGESIFKNLDIPLEINPEGAEKPSSLI